MKWSEDKKSGRRGAWLLVLTSVDASSNLTLDSTFSLMMVDDFIIPLYGVGVAYVVVLRMARH